MYRKHYPLIFVLLLLIFTLLPLQAHESTDIYISGLRATPCENVNNVSSVFMTVDNTAVAHPIALIGASSPVAEHIHLVEGDGGCAEGMTERIVIPSGETLDFRESGYAIAVELNEAYEAGEAFSLILTFDMLDEDLNSDDMTVDVVVGVPVLEEAPSPSNILVTMSWARPTAMEDMSEHNHDDEHTHDDMEMDAPMFPVAVYMRLFNQGAEDERLIAVSSPAAEIAEIHETTVENDVVSMNAIEALELPAGEWVSIDPGGYHIMLVNLHHDLYEGDAILLTLTFESGTEMTIAVPVYDAMIGEMDSEHEHEHNG